MFTLAAAKLLGAGQAAVMMAGLLGLAIATPLPSHRVPQPEMRHVELAGGRQLAVGRYEVTARQWQGCVAAGVCPALPEAHRPDKADRPMTGVNALDVQAYVSWVNAESGRRFRLPTATEWRDIALDLPKKPAKKLFDDPRLAWAADYGNMEQVPAVVQASGHFGSLANGIADLGGNVWEWTATCAAPGFGQSTCPAFLAEGLHEAAVPIFIRDPASGGCAAGTPPANVGFRLVEDI